ncbi:MAG: ATP phosphoribosyltransferase [Pseudomonadota bacterium]
MIKLGIPSKGRLQADTIAWFAERGVHITLAGAGREYAGDVDGVEGVALVLLSAGEIPRELAAGRIHLGVTGQDLIAEQLGPQPTQVAQLAPMGFGYADLVLAVPAFWRDVWGVDDLDAVAARLRAAQGHRLRIATKYHNIVRRYLQDQGVADYVLVDSQGATEGTVKNETAEAIADITSTGATLEANHLKMLDYGPILQSQATLFAARTAPWQGHEGAWQTLRDTLGVPQLPWLQG